jgi:hypothetical protein
MRRTLFGAAVAGWIAASAGLASAQLTGPSTSTTPYLLPSNPALPAGSVQTTSILTVGDGVGGYRMVGIPDGLGAFANGRTFTLLMNHELGDVQGIPRSHGSPGAFVSRWTIDRKSLAVLKGGDNATSPSDVYRWDLATQAYVAGTVAWNRFCSADLARPGAFFYRDFGTRERIFLNGEETRPPFSADHGRAWAHIATGTDRGEVWELPRLGKMSIENVVASPHPQRKTVVMLLDDASADTSTAPGNVPSELYVYVGTKTRHGTHIERAGLTNGTLFGVQVTVGGAPVGGESDAFGLGSASYVGSGRFTLVSLGNVANKTGIQLQTDSIAAGVTRMQRIEDGTWDPRPSRRNDFYFVTTASVTTNSRLWRLRFHDVEHPEQGGTIEILLTGSEGHRMLDNVTMDRQGRILMQEDVGNNDRLGKVWLYDTHSGQLVEIAQHDPARFAPGAPAFLTRDEEASGIIDASRILGRGWFLLDVQAHYAIGDPQLVEGGQLLALYVDPSIGGAPHEEDADDDHHHGEHE